MTEITPTQHQFVADNRPHYDTLVKAGFLTNISQQQKDGMLEIARIFYPGYVANLWCSPCVCDLVKYAYGQYDKWVAEQPKELPKDVQFATFPKQDKPKRQYNRK